MEIRNLFNTYIIGSIIWVFHRRKEWCATPREDWVWQGSQRRFKLQPWRWPHTLHCHFSGVPLHAEKNSRSSRGRIWFVKLSFSFSSPFLIMHIVLWKFTFQGLKVRIQPELSAIVARTSQLLLERYTCNCDIVFPLTLSDLRIDHMLQLQRKHYKLCVSHECIW